MTPPLVARKATYLGVFLVTLSTLAYEVLLTRIFSVTMWYHFAFMAISIAMFGMTLGALRVYLRPERFPLEQTDHALARSALLTSLFMIVGIAAHIALGPLINNEWEMIGLTGTFLSIALPFYQSGVCVCLVLTRFPQQTSKLYAADLAGAAVGCLLVIILLRWVDAVAAVAIVALLTSLGSLSFAAGERGTIRLAGLVVCLLLGGVAAAHMILAAVSASPLQITWTKGGRQDQIYYEKWNSFSRLVVVDGPQTPFGWSLSRIYEPQGQVRHYWLNIDSVAGTLLTEFDGDLIRVDYLKYDVTNFAHYLRPDSKVLVIGSGGGTDILSALVFKQKEVVGIEMNEDILGILTEKYGDFTGHLERLPQVRFVNEEGRSYVAGSQEPVDILQITFIDTWAATAAGAFVLSENALYTRESWKIFLERLTPRGILTVCRGYVTKSPYEIYRLTALARAALRAIGVDKPEDHIAVVANRTPREFSSWGHMATILVSRSPFSEADLDLMEQTAKRLEFDLLLTPRQSQDENFRRLTTQTKVAELEDELHLTLEAPTDEKPFFFQMLKPRDFLMVNLFARDIDPNQRAVGVLFRLLVIVTVLSLLCILLPLAWSTRTQDRKGALPWLVYFGCVGLGFMFVEISQMQRLILFLGHPIYGLSVILFALLLAGGLGSYLTNWISDEQLSRMAPRCLAALLVVMAVFGFASVPILAALQHGTTGVRLAVALAILFLLGVFMGTAFPLGIRLAQARVPQLTPWLWGINGATSVWASVLAVAIALAFGISASFWTGVACYLVAALALLAARRPRLPGQPELPSKSEL